ncbi:hypothetical protein [Amycolatopsis jejuensis]|uniref:hypothetical protein n=1 Tax=Amycolatopsis jejuensis TaxID=330084 RepID=UPI0005253A86|nr:hypothetical protein [Amycolatopsis jejuensis]
MTQLLYLICGLFLFTAVLVLWRRELPVLVRVLVAQGVALAAMAAVLGLAVTAVGLLILRAGVLPWLVRRMTAQQGPDRRETRPVVNVTASLLSAALLALVAYAVSRPLAALDPSPASAAVAVGLTVVLIGFFVLVTRRRAVSQLVGFLVLDNGITATGLLLGADPGLLVEIGVSLDVLLAVLVLQILSGRMRQLFGSTDLGELRELRD